MTDKIVLSRAEVERAIYRQPGLSANAREALCAELLSHAQSVTDAGVYECRGSRLQVHDPVIDGVIHCLPEPGSLRRVLLAPVEEKVG